MKNTMIDNMMKATIDNTNFIYLSSLAFSSFKDDISKIEELKIVLIEALLNDIILLHHVGKEYSYSYLSYDEKFINFFNDVLINAKPKDDIIYDTIMKKLIVITLSNPKSSLIDTMISLHEDYGFCIEDIGECIKQRDELTYVIKQEFVDRNMFSDAFTETIKSVDISELEW